MLMFMSMPAARRFRVLMDGLACPVSMRLMSHWAMAFVPLLPYNLMMVVSFKR